MSEPLDADVIHGVDRDAVDPGVVTEVPEPEFGDGVSDDESQAIAEA